MAFQFRDGTWGVRVLGVYKARKQHPSPVDKAVGDGRYGYRTRPAPEGTTEVIAWDGQPLLRSNRKSAAKHQKAGCRLVSRVDSRPVDGAIVRERNQAVEQRRFELRDSRPRFRARKGQRPAV